MTTKIDRALRGPSWLEVIIGALLSLAIGVLLGAVLLILRPVVVVKEMPKEEERDPSAVYFVEGARNSIKARDALAKRKAFVEGQSVTVIEDELNALVGPAGAFAPPKAGEKAPEKSSDAAASVETLATGTPNFRVRDGTMQVGMPVTLNLLGLSEKLVVQTRGGFMKQGDVFVYEPYVFYVGSLPLQRLPILSNYARDKFLNAESIPEDIKASWMKLVDVSINGNALTLTMP